jgi:hypothetical protein
MISGSSRLPYRKVVDGRVTEKIEYLTGDREEGFQRGAGQCAHR